MDFLSFAANAARRSGLLAPALLFCVLLPAMAAAGLERGYPETRVRAKAAAAHPCTGLHLDPSSLGHRQNLNSRSPQAKANLYSRNDPVNFVDPTGTRAVGRASPQMTATLWEMKNAELRYSQGIEHTKESLRDVVTSARNGQWEQAKFFLAQAAGNVRNTISAVKDRFLADPALGMVGVGGVIQTGKVAGSVALSAGKNFKSHFGRARALVQEALGVKIGKLKAGGSDELLGAIGKGIDDGVLKSVGQGTLKKGGEVMDIFRGNGLTVVAKPGGEFVTVLKSDQGLDKAIQFVR